MNERKNDSILQKTWTSNIWWLNILNAYIVYHSERIERILFFFFFFFYEWETKEQPLFLYQPNTWAVVATAYSFPYVSASRKKEEAV